MKIVKKSMALLGTVGVMSALAGASYAAPVIEESFVYDTGALNGSNGGTGFSGAWSATRNNPPVFSPGLTAGDLAVAGNAVNGNAWSGVARPIGSTLSNAGLLDDGATLWFSVIMDLAGANLSNADLNMALTDSSKFVSNNFGSRYDLDGGASQGIGVGHTGGNIRGMYWQDTNADSDAERNLSGASTLQLDPTGTNNPTGALIVGKIEWGVGAGDETLTLYNPDTNLNLGTPVLAATAFPALNQSGFDTLAIQFKDSTPKIDEIRFGATSADVLVPEPSSLALIALGGLLVARRRRK